MGTVNFVTDFSQVNALAHRLGVDAKPAIEHEIVTTMRRVILPAQRQAVAKARKDTGQLRDNISNIVELADGGVVGLITTKAKHAPVMELGRKPGGKMPPKGSLIKSGWMRRHNIPDNREFLIRRAIARRGIRADHNMENAVKAREEFARREFSECGPRVIQRLVKGAR